MRGLVAIYRELSLLLLSPASRLSALTLLLGSFFFAWGQPLSLPATLQPSNVFDLHKVVPSAKRQGSFTIQGLRSSQTGLYFLISDNPSIRHPTVIHTDYGGVYRGIVQLPQSAEVRDFDVDSSGFLFALAYDKADPSGTKILVYRPDGTLDRSAPASPTATALCLAGGDRSVVDSSPRVSEMSWLSKLTPAVGSHPVVSPRNVAFSSVGASAGGEVFALIAHFRLSDGAPVLNFHGNGNMPGTVRCVLPTFDSDKTTNNPTGAMVPQFLSAGLNSILVLASGNGEVALYSYGL
ncbi:MAG TPA: hypothetical protein VG675_15180 [Bryobacteraceae bacterium]|nr:hypothetical protein [Bryobacteraceae bacterium]